MRGPVVRAVSGLVAVVAAVLALQPGMPAVVPGAMLVIGAFLLWPVVVRNRVELYKDRLEIVFGWGRTIIPYDHVTGVRRLAGGPGDATATTARPARTASSSRRRRTVTPRSA